MAVDGVSQADRLAAHADFFDSLLSLVPSKYYIHEEAHEDDVAWSKYHRVSGLTSCAAVCSRHAALQLLTRRRPTQAPSLTTEQEAKGATAGSEGGVQEWEAGKIRGGVARHHRTAKGRGCRRCRQQ